MRRLLTALAAGAMLLLAAPTAPAGAQATTDVYLVHGLNLAFQTSPSDGGTAVTVCSGDTQLLNDFQFGQTVGPLALPSDAAVAVQVYLGADVDCAAPGGSPVIDQLVTPTGAAVAVIATAPPQGGAPAEQLVPELMAVPIDIGCVDAGNGRAVAVHAANAPQVDVVNTDLGVSVGMIGYDEQISGALPVGTYGIEVYIVGGPPTPAMSFDIPVTDGMVTVGIAVGNQPVDGFTPLVLIPLTIDVETCAAPTTATTQAVAAAAAQPSFTG